MSSNPRLFISHNFPELPNIEKSQVEYLTKVLRLKVEDSFVLFNQNFGEWNAVVQNVNPFVFKLTHKIREFTAQENKIFCAFSIIKPKNVELIVQKCTEIGVCGFIPLVTERSQFREINIERLTKIAIEASEQCGRIDIPTIQTPIKLKEIQEVFTQNVQFVLLNQHGCHEVEIKNDCDVCVIVGSEGGFSEDEVENLCKFSQKMCISSNILRAETAAIIGCGIVANQVRL